MDRRRFLGSGLAAGAGAAAIAAPAVAQSAPELRWRLTSAFPTSLETLHGAGKEFARYVSDATDGRFTIQVFGPGEIVGPLDGFDAVSNGTVEMAHTGSHYSAGTDITFALGTSIPCGMNSRMMMAWLSRGGGNELLNGFYGKYGVHHIPCGQSPAMMAGWFREPVTSLDDFDGLKFRVTGMASHVLQRLGVVPQAIPIGDAYSALERGTIDALKFTSPADDVKLGFVQVAPYYHYPSVWENGSNIGLFINREAWEALPTSYQRTVEAAADHANNWMLAGYDSLNPTALRELLAQGAKLTPMPADVQEAVWNAAHEYYDELSAENPEWKKIYSSYRDFRDQSFSWWQIAELPFDAFVARALRT